jgi:adenosyl cobinamide kinase/adenosyl cobinamide phosphate guanylyltransferase
MSLTMLLGGARSGKSRLALSLAARSSSVVFIATGEARDEEMADRIERHRAERPAEWQTVEEPLRLREALADAPPGSAVIVDCLSFWVANLLEHSDAEAVEAEAVAAAAVATARPGSTIAVSNEVGLGIVPVTPLGRAYRDVLGRVNSLWVDASAEAFFVIAGRTLRLEELDG